ncbi:MauE/DoxX family redox-associated membrane protein [Halorubrum rutilum]|uniref:MauE/DoxX family redox-associated membrane protein n=1 Tax=Halorubrum rutilum TaxID=1364933 RepID=A0ABD6AP54_9EURY|nr:MauE/DoxX family redox-associated membrane protein [Halorubrum rutilum]
MSDETESDADSAGPLARRKRSLRRVMGAVYVVAGVSHFLAPESFARAVPPEFPRPRALVYLSGVAEVLLGLGMQFDRTRRASAWGIVALLVAVFPANVYMATDDVAAEFVPSRFAEVARAAAWARLPLQAMLVLWAWWHSLPDPGAGDGVDGDVGPGAETGTKTAARTGTETRTAG